ncbi:hypothetical protein ABG067_006843 [Albugo candida]
MIIGIGILRVIILVYLHNRAVHATLSNDQEVRFTGLAGRLIAKRLDDSIASTECLTYRESDGLWQYEWCFNQHVRQYRRYEQNNSVESFIMGKYIHYESRTYHIMCIPGSVTTNMYYLSQKFTQGDNCMSNTDILRRATDVRFKCCGSGVDGTFIQSVEKPASCSHIVWMCAPVVCELQGETFVEANGMEEEERLEWLQVVKDMFYHAYHGYMDHAFPSDDLLPLSCRGGSFALSKIPLLTLIDALDMLAILEDRVEFERGIRYVIEHTNFDLDENVSVFETTIRVLGGLLSAHMFAINERLALLPNGMYKNELLTLAIDIADRLMPAFQSESEIPYGTVNLRRGVPIGETTIANTAGAGSLTMEFTMLSVLTGDIKYANASRISARALYESRSKAGLLGKHIDIQNRMWREMLSGIGVNADSVYEYYLKMYMNFGDVEFLRIFEEMYDAIMTHNRVGDWYTNLLVAMMLDQEQVLKSNSGSIKAPLVPVYRTFQLHTAPSTAIKLISFTCSVQVLLDPISSTEEHYEDTTVFRFPCIQSKVGGFSFFPHSIAFAMAGLVVADPIDACTKLQGDHYRGKYVIVDHGMCTHEEKAVNVIASGAIALLVWVTKKLDVMADDVVVDASALNRPDDSISADTIAIPIAIVSNSVGDWLCSFRDTGMGLRLDLETSVNSNLDVSQRSLLRTQAVQKEVFPFLMLSKKHPDKIWLSGPQWGVVIRSFNISTAREYFAIFKYSLSA